MEIHSPVIEIVITMLGLLLTASIVLGFSKRFKIPFTVLLVLVGIAITHVTQLLPQELYNIFQYQISPEIILYICLPTLIFESAYNLDVRAVQRNLAPIMTLAVPGLLLSTLLIGIIVSGFTHIDFASSLLLGAILSATDPVAVIALFNQLGAPKRLTILIEGESLFNDATAIVTAKIIFAILLSGVFTWHQLGHGIFEFFEEFFGGILIGWLLARVIAYILGKVESDPYIEISLTTILAYTSFIVAQDFMYTSGVMATVAAGLTMNKWGHMKISPTITEYLEHFWEYLSYIANALIFLMVGLSVHLGALFQSYFIIGIVIVAMLASRAIVIFGIVPIIGKLFESDAIDRNYQTVMYWGGLRGAIALAIVLSLGKFEHNQLFIAITTGAVLFTLLVQGLTIDTLMRFLGLDKPPIADRLSTLEAELMAKRQVVARIPELQKGGMFSATLSQELTQRCDNAIERATNKLDSLRQRQLTQETEEKLIYMQCLAVEKKLYYEMFSNGHLSTDAYRNLIDLIEVQSDILRYGGTIEEVKKIHISDTKLQNFMISIVERLPLFNQFTQKLRARRLARHYEEYWGLHQGTHTILEFLDELETAESTQSSTIQQIRADFKAWHQDTSKLIDGISEQFPEFAMEMQKRLAERLIYQAEYDAITEQATAGLIPESIAQIMHEEIEADIFKLRERPNMAVEIDPMDLLRNIPFLQHLPAQDFSRIAKYFKQHIAPIDEIIIKQGDVGQSMFLIVRGVVRVCIEKGGGLQDVATLMAGDFFGEIALLNDIPRVATCRAVTPCALYELTRHDFNEVCSAHPHILNTVKEEMGKRWGE